MFTLWQQCHTYELMRQNERAIQYTCIAPTIPGTVIQCTILYGPLPV